MDGTSEVVYPRLLRRVQALLIDGLIIPFAAIAVMMGVSHYGLSGVYAASAAIITIFLLDPVLVSYTGGSVGHHLRGLKVVHSARHHPINLVRASLRFVLKVPLGWLSLVTYFTSRRYQAIHDFASGSVVVLSLPDRVRGYERREERVFQESGFRYQPLSRQILAIVFSNLIFITTTMIIVGLLIEMSCQYFTSYCEVISFVFGITWEIMALLFLAVSIYYCRYGRFLGCRRKPLTVRS